MLSRPVSASSAELIARHLKVLGQPVRVRLIETLDRCGEASVGELAAGVDVSVFDASQHLAILRNAGLVKRRKAGRQQLYRLAGSGRALAIYEHVAAELLAQVDDAGASDNRP